ncbi:MAG: Uma2 family endonuclease [Aggregatilineales bacterium]
MAEMLRERMSAAEFARLTETTQPTELIDGALIVSPSPMPAHQRLLREIFWVLRSTIDAGEFFLAPIDVVLDEENVVQPDLVWVGPGSRCEVGQKQLVGPPDLIVEVLSPSSALRDKTVKFMLYERRGVREYWIADPANQYVEVWTLDADSYRRLGVFGHADTFISLVLEASVSLAAVFPRSSEEIGGPAAAAPSPGSNDAPGS